MVRLQRFGKRTQPHFRVVAIDKRAGSGGKPLEVLGHYNPKVDKAAHKANIDMSRLESWLKKGAVPSETVSSLLKKLK